MKSPVDGTRTLALRLATQRAQVADGGVDVTGAAAADRDRDMASTPGVVDLLARRRELQQPELRDDLDDVFARYYATHPDTDGLAVFDE